MTAELEQVLAELIKLHNRLELFMGTVWANEMKIALSNIALQGKRAYLDLLRDEVSFLIKREI